MKDKYQLKRKEDELWESGEDEVTRGKRDAISFLRGELEPITDADVAVPQSDEDLDNLIAILRTEKEGIPEYSLFGDPNWKITDAQIEICEWAKGS